MEGHTTGRCIKNRGAPCNLGLVLEGDDARRFDEYLENPTCTPEGVALIAAAMRHHRHCQKEAWCLACGHIYGDGYDGALNTSICRKCGADAVVWGSSGAHTYATHREG
ncbi:MAG: hypothetical protein PHR28_04910 [candidate division Zixibacteria bacterium]|nr:hypothetical protein [candidate division Zixibacteria bacterium]